MITYAKILIVLILMATTQCFSQQHCPSPKPLDLKEATGEWKGNFTYDGDLKKVTIQISEQKGTLISKVSIPDMSKANLSAFTKICSGEELHIEVVVNDKKFDFRGKPKKGKMSGRLISKDIMNETLREVFTLKRI
ncbi:hypothetical protein [Aquimarina sp. 2201CG5-10]|uniref:hypothetical protein n=1 Tax=Aquimarina callyspongiae TaxID=3098150 RepID=UPI002AB39A8F|nr:hypothetical protein [Aquimarina sp. 2201CG5-10]MDY8135188.1 hypothetical protein [Aquimarina sp. 2201CG5-10]